MTINTGNFCLSAETAFRRLFQAEPRSLEKGKKRTNQTKSNQNFALGNAIEIRLFISCTQSEI